MTGVTLVLGASVLLQGVAAVLAFRLMRLTGRRTAWMLIAMSLSLMAVRRSITLFRLISGDVSQPPDLAAELVALAISGLMVAGIASIRPLFLSVKRSKEIVRETHEWYRDLDRQVGYASFFVGLDGRIQTANPRALELLGYGLDALAGRPVFDLCPDTPTGEPKVRKLFAGSRAGEEIDAEEVEMSRADGQGVWTSLSMRPIRSPGGRIVSTRWIVVDISERKQAEQRVQHFAELVNSIQSGLYVYHLEDVDDDRTLRLIFANPAAGRLTGLPIEVLLTKTLDENFPGLREKGVPQLFAEVVRTGQPRDVEDFDYGDLRVIEAAWAFKAFPLPNRCVGVAFEDVTRRKRAEEALRVSERRFAGILEIAADAVISVDEAQQITLFNRGAEEIFGYRAEEVLGKPLDVLLPARFVEAHRTHIRGFAASATVARLMNERGVIFGRRKDGTEFPAEGAISKLDLDGARIFTAILRDVTERKGLEDQLFRAQRMEAVGRLAGGVAHDFNNMLTAILGYTDLLLTDLDRDDQRRVQVDEIKKAADRASSLTRQLLAFSRQQVLQPKVLDLNAVVTEIETMLRRLIGEDVELVSVLEPTVARIKADPGQIEQVIVNLAINARDAMPEGGKVTIETANVELDEAYARRHVAVVPGPYVMLAVSDTGVGMDAETQDRIFEPFFTTKEKGKGTGLGLATVYGIVRQSGGNIWVYSEPGRGTTFKIYLPRVEEAAEPLPVREDPVSMPRGMETVLLVEDEPAVRELAARVLRNQGYAVLEAPNGEEALRMAQMHRDAIHLLLTDAILPGIGGEELAEQFRFIRPGAKVLYMSGYTENAFERHGLLEPGAVFLQKPFTPATLTRKVRDVLDIPVK